MGPPLPGSPELRTHQDSHRQCLPAAPHQRLSPETALSLPAWARVQGCRGQPLGGPPDAGCRLGSPHSHLPGRGVKGRHSCGLHAPRSGSHRNQRIAKPGTYTFGFQGRKVPGGGLGVHAKGEVGPPLRPSVPVCDLGRERAPTGRAGGSSPVLGQLAVPRAQEPA